MGKALIPRVLRKKVKVVNIDARAVIISVCQKCNQVIDFSRDIAGGGGQWTPPTVGATIDLDVITKVDSVAGRHSGLPLFVVELDTSANPHC